jgi:tetratricopeptide (TPR) repeat protein
MDEAIELCKVLVKEFPKSAASHKRLGDLYLKNNDIKKAIKCYKKSLKLDPNNKEVIELLKGLGVSP